MSVVLPDPERPTMATNSPRRTVRFDVRQHFGPPSCGPKPLDTLAQFEELGFVWFQAFVPRLLASQLRTD